MIYPTLSAAVAELKPDDKRRVYRILDKCAGVPRERYVIAASPSAAALVTLGEESVVLVGQRERYNAALEALMQTNKK
jgi:hypothetical protein